MEVRENKDATTYTIGAWIINLAVSRCKNRFFYRNAGVFLGYMKDYNA